jgi:hypothetical protein
VYQVVSGVRTTGFEISLLKKMELHFNSLGEALEITHGTVLMATYFILILSIPLGF